MGQVRSLDEQLNAAGYLRLTTTKPYVKHMGNRLEAPAATEKGLSIANERKRIVDLPVIRRPLLWIYDGIFKLYNQ